MKLKCFLYHDWKYYYKVYNERVGWATAVEGCSYQICSRCGKTLINEKGREVWKDWTF